MAGTGRMGPAGRPMYRCGGVHASSHAQGVRVPAMAGKFLTLEEAARRLGVAVEDVNRLVDRKELFPMRDGTTIKFKVDEIERVAADLAADRSSASSDLALDLNLSAVAAWTGAGADAGDDDFVLSDSDDDDDSIFGDDLGEIEQGPKTAGGGTDAGAASGTFDVDDMGLDLILAASSPSLGGPAGQPPAAGDSDALELDFAPTPSSSGGLPADSGLDLGSGGLEIDLGEGSAPGKVELAGESGTLEIDLSGIGGGSAPLSGLGGPVSGISAAVDSGLSLEKDALGISGIDLDDGGAAAGLGSGVDAFGSGIGGEAFDLGGDSAGLDDGESVVVSPEESGDSSFFTSAMDDASSTSFGGSSGGVPGGGLGFDDVDLAIAPSFSVWQVVGLVCCTLLMFAGGLLVFDIVSTVRSPQGSPFASVVIDGLTSTFGW